MIIQTTYNKSSFRCDLSKPIDLSIPVGQVRCFYATEFKTSPYKSGDFVGAVSAGAPVNFFDVQMNPHGNGTHTECLGHITTAQENISDKLLQFHFFAQLVSVPVTKINNEDKVITKEALAAACPAELPEALVIRTLPNDELKLTADYSGTNPPYLELGAMAFLVESGVRHLLLDLPSVDREEDEGKLAAHHLFWNIVDKSAKDNSRADCTITELIYVPTQVRDGLYLLNIQIPSLPLDAAPSKPVLYQLENIENK